MLNASQKRALAEELGQNLDAPVDEILQRFGFTGSDDPLVQELLASRSFQREVRQIATVALRERARFTAAQSLVNALPVLDGLVADPTAHPSARVAGVAALARIAGMDEDGDQPTRQVTINLNLPAPTTPVLTLPPEPSAD